MDHAVDGAEQLGDAAGGDEADEVEGVPQPLPLGFGDEPVAEHAVPDEHGSDLRVRRKDRRRGGQDIVVPLPLEESGRRPEGDLVVGWPQLAADLVPGQRGIQEGLDVHAAGDGPCVTVATTWAVDRAGVESVGTEETRIMPNRKSIE